MANAEGTVQRRSENNEIKTNRKKMKKGVCSYQSSWADLPQELLDMISNDLNIADYLRFGRVCRSWRTFISEHKLKFMSSQSPLVIYMSTRYDENSCYFFDIITGMRYKTNLPKDNWDFKSCLGVSSGYLIMYFMKRVHRLEGHFCLINPVTGHQLQFPSTPFPLYIINYYISNICRAIFASIGSQDQDYLIVILSRKLDYLQFFISRDNRWRNHSYYVKNNNRVLDIAVFDGRLFVLTEDSQIGMFNLRSCNLRFLELKFAPRFDWYRSRLVASDDQLLIVYNFEVYRIDFSKMEWVKVNNLGEKALFIGYGDKCCKLINPTVWGGRSNCIYILDDEKICEVYSLNGGFLGILPLMGKKFCPGTCSWYFISQSNSIDNIKDD
ncbi:uncharacterized protein LOC116116023 [Pistacia vera]|uniref:uncharacterized protein LOC116116023 n=1 Tax=Pistacia vera TaxID=55513 RepID=UPI0012633409|nr:uncharacterized protein LOC116116023 [Pistacia vera]